MVKTNYHIKLKGYSDNTRKYVQNVINNKININDLVLNGYSFEDNIYNKLINRKLKEFNKQSIKFDDMGLDENINKWLKNLEIKNYDTDEIIKLNDEQLNMVNKQLQKKYGFIQSSMGTNSHGYSLFIV